MQHRPRMDRYHSDGYRKKSRGGEAAVCLHTHHHHYWLFSPDCTEGERITSVGAGSKAARDAEWKLSREQVEHFTQSRKRGNSYTERYYVRDGSESRARAKDYAQTQDGETDNKPGKESHTRGRSGSQPTARFQRSRTVDSRTQVGTQDRLRGKSKEKGAGQEEHRRSGSGAGGAGGAGTEETRREMRRMSTGRVENGVVNMLRFWLC